VNHPLRPAAALLIALAACAPKITPTTAREMPEALPSRPWTMPTAAEGRLPNGVRVVVVTNREVPLWDVRLLLDGGSRLDATGKEGLYGATFDMMDEGAAGASTSEIARKLKLLGGSVYASAGLNGAGVHVSGPKKNLAPLLTLWADALLRPDFPADRWEILRENYLAGLRAERERATSIADRVTRVLVWGPSYAGRSASEATISGLTLDEMRTTWQGAITPERATILVGGDLSLEEVLPELERALADWTGAGAALPAARPEPKPPGPARLYFVDKPGAAQSVLQAALPLLRPDDPEHHAMHIANTVLGGAFTARINMNLREDKGYTYGARCGIELTLGPEIWTCSTSVNTAVTGPAMLELMKEVKEAVTTRPLEQREVDFFRSYRVNAFQSAYETPASLLDEIGRIQTLRLPSDWMQRYVPAVDAVDAAKANAALQRWLKPERVAWVVVGDKAKVFDALAPTGLEIVELDREGNPMETR
jgi:predicted Zn-dependent peptidase